METTGGLRQGLYTGLTIVISLAISLALVEFVLAWQTKSIQSSEKIAPGFLIYDKQLGWRLAPNWKGRHHHYDFDVLYTTNLMGLRGEWKRPDKSKRRYALLGDSFTFGLGVNDNETFTALLNRQQPNEVFLNLGQPGYSTDQEYLYLRDRLILWQADEAWLIVYLANDLFDNTLDYPLQAQMPKPHFSLADGNLIPPNPPVPANRDAPPKNRPTLASMVLGDERAKALADNPFSHLELTRRLGFFTSSAKAVERDFPQRFAYPLTLFFNLVRAIQETCTRQGIPLKLLLMPSRSLIEQPGTYAATFQDYLRRAILSEQQRLNVPVIDLTEGLRAWRQSQGEPIFHPNEGHLNVDGNKAVAAVISQNNLITGR